MYEACLNSNSPAGDDGNVRRIISRLIEYIEQENLAIEENGNFDFVLSSERKSRLLFEFNRANATLDPTHLADETVAGLRRLKHGLIENERRIASHVSAVKEVSGILVDIMRDEENDGTYGEYPRKV